MIWGYFKQLSWFILLFCCQFAVLFQLSPRFFWTDDAITQYSPAMWWLGKHQLSGQPPLINPELGAQASFVMDMQYGVLDPFHWLLQFVASRFSDFVPFSWSYCLFCLFLIGLATLVILNQFQVSPVLGAVTALAASSSGFLLWMGSSWWPVLWSSAGLLWLIAALLLRSRYSLIVLAIASAMLFSSGYPYVIVLGVVVLGVYFLLGIRAIKNSELAYPDYLLRLAAIFAGVIWALPTLISLLQLRNFISRPIYSPELYALLGNTTLGVPNFVDVLLSPSTMFSNLIWPIPFFSTASWVFPLVAFINFKKIRVFGDAKLSLLIGIGLISLVLTQLPSNLLGLRNPFIYMVGYGFTIPLAIIIGISNYRVFSKNRLYLSISIAVLQTYLAWSRSPTLWKWHLLSFAVSLVLLLAVLSWLTSYKKILRGFSVVVLITLVCITTFIPYGMMVSLELMAKNGEIVTQSQTQDTPFGQPYRFRAWWQIPTTSISELQSFATFPNQNLTVFEFEQSGVAGMLYKGIGPHNLPLISDSSLGFGYNAAVQTPRQVVDCRNPTGSSCVNVSPLLVEEPRSGLPWVELISQPKVAVDDSAPAELISYFEEKWVEQDSLSTKWRVFVRPSIYPGRITYTQNVTVDNSHWKSSLGYVNSSLDEYQVTTTDKPGFIVMYTIPIPGLKATLNGNSIPIIDIGGAVSGVEIPPNIKNGSLVIRYAPAGTSIMNLCFSASVILALFLVIIYRNKYKGNFEKSA